MNTLTLSHDPRISRRQLSTLAKQGRRPASHNLRPGARIKTEPIPTAPVERRSYANRPGAPRLTLETQPRTFSQSLRLLGKMMEQ